MNISLPPASVISSSQKCQRSHTLQRKFLVQTKVTLNQGGTILLLSASVSNAQEILPLPVKNLIQFIIAVVVPSKFFIHENLLSPHAIKQT